MSLQAILEEIFASGERQVVEIEKNAQTQIGEILAQAQMEADQINEDISRDVSTPAIAERARILHRARLESLRIVGGVREDLVDTAINRTRERLASFRTNHPYSMVLRSLIREALAELASGGTQNVQLLVDHRDKTLLEEILDDLKLNLPVSYELNCWGGLIARSEDRRVVVTNTFESRLEHATSFLRSHLAALFEEEEEPVIREPIHA